MWKERVTKSGAKLKVGFSHKPLMDNELSSVKEEGSDFGRSLQELVNEYYELRGEKQEGREEQEEVPPSETSPHESEEDGELTERVSDSSGEDLTPVLEASVPLPTLAVKTPIIKPVAVDNNNADEEQVLHRIESKSGCNFICSCERSFPTEKAFRRHVQYNLKVPAGTDGNNHLPEEEEENKNKEEVPSTLTTPAPTASQNSKSSAESSGEGGSTKKKRKRNKKTKNTS
ncbi:unnamed protein product [Orchesella dallaii]|uniref:C2H2-type domain-containing protein n=1 Tax=Orchesella dallaii TaxID=48710 RepID=A0ABP1S4P3_9HEXA